MTLSNRLRKIVWRLFAAVPLLAVGLMQVGCEYYTEVPVPNGIVIKSPEGGTTVDTPATQPEGGTTVDTPATQPEGGTTEEVPINPEENSGETAPPTDPAMSPMILNGGIKPLYNIKWKPPQAIPDDDVSDQDDDPASGAISPSSGSDTSPEADKGKKEDENNKQEGPKTGSGKIAALKVEIQTGNIPDAGTDTDGIIWFQICPDAKFAKNQCFSAKFNDSYPADLTLNKGSWEALEFPGVLGNIYKGGKQLEDLKLADLKYFRFVPDNEEYVGDGWFLQGVRILVRLEEASEFVPIYTNPCVGRWIENDRTYYGPGGGWESSPYAQSGGSVVYGPTLSSVHSIENDVAYCFYIETGTGDDAGTDDTVSVRIPIKSGQTLPSFTTNWMESYQSGVSEGDKKCFQYEHVTWGKIIEGECPKDTTGCSKKSWEPEKPGCPTDTKKLTYSQSDKYDNEFPTIQSNGNKLTVPLHYDGFDDFGSGNEKDPPNKASYTFTVPEGVEKVQEDQYSLSLSGTDGWKLGRVKAYSFRPGGKEFLDKNACRYHDTETVNTWLDGDDGESNTWPPYFSDTSIMKEDTCPSLKDIRIRDGVSAFGVLDEG